MRSRWMVAAVVLAACATTGGRTRYGEISLRPYGAALATPVVFSVQEGRILSPNVDLVVDPDGCIRGNVVNGPVVLCNRGQPPPPLGASDNRVEQWTGTGGNFTLELQDAGKMLRMDGYLRPTSGVEIPMEATVPLGKGPQWDELRKHPAFLAIAAAVAGIRGEPDPNSMPDRPL